jgi:hypothetical protein
LFWLLIGILQCCYSSLCAHLPLILLLFLLLLGTTLLLLLLLRLLLVVLLPAVPLLPAPIAGIATASITNSAKSAACFLRDCPISCC